MVDVFGWQEKDTDIKDIDALISVVVGEVTNVIVEVPSNVVVGAWAPNAWAKDAWASGSWVGF